ncbi:hypothetical protein HD806DRAFT_516004 [Xylariaceae sp. AK1471]|nr:hypothetical protein HD806DRAFT_516004 [Xylariaceae sp. AK1471]
MEALKLVSAHHFDQASGMPKLASPHINILASHYTVNQELRNSRETLQPVIETVFDMLPNQQEADDWRVYSSLGGVLLVDKNFSGNAAEGITPDHLAVLESKSQTWS